MGFREVGGVKSYVKYKECVKGDVLVEGKYIRSFQGKFGIQHEFDDVNVGVKVLNSSGQLNYKMDFIRPNEVVKIVYEGMITLDKGAMKGKDSHQFTVLRDEDFEDLAEDTAGEPSVDSGDGGIDDFSDL